MLSIKVTHGPLVLRKVNLSIVLDISNNFNIHYPISIEWEAFQVDLVILVGFIIHLEEENSKEASFISNIIRIDAPYPIHIKSLHVNPSIANLSIRENPNNVSFKELLSDVNH